ncbi:mandelate racemase [Paraburkholderia sp. Ac-20336]|uniref:enolase C-terminal domain-like protein n=1 Tax=Burkholderiaceae TaxID=119060 RepID=UPI00141DF2D3|nr:MULTISPECIES: enolase C-terminal domain-like protein [Burkholderiaceae]MBN3805741.1 mandelate racemase [Paraburkholderia sp. Ac-20336]MBN3850468.1 mandelate racemase [Paraburkholderia sp. Ac-20342]NIF52232.1 mandelate racemase [Burkholderia sp. Ax-1724]NIF81306.1 mandelate racemase [Paraburkholderia sp. Cy-641]
MRITSVREISVPLEGNVANALVSFAEHDVSLVALETDVVRNGKPVIGYAFDSIGRFAQGGILRERMIPRLEAAAPETLLDASGELFDPEAVLKTVLRNEKPGGHGDRAAAAGALELAVWDLNAKLRDEPAYVTIARHYGRAGKREGVNVYAAGGYYYPDDSVQRLADEFSGYRAMGFDAFKMKIGGADLKTDLARIEAALTVAGEGQRLAVDANGRFDLETALAYAKAIAPYDLRWYEEIGDPLDFDLNRQVAQAYAGRIATGENLFSVPDVKNLALFGGMRPGKDIFQMDAGLAYGLTEYARMIELIERHGFDRAQAYPHGGHLINLHIAVGLELGGCEAYPGVFQPFGGYPAGCGIGGGLVRPTDAAGFGLEEKDGLRPWLARLSK